MSMFATSADYWKARAELAEATVHETAHELGCEPDNELMLEAAHGLKADADRYRWLRAHTHATRSSTGRQVFALPTPCPAGHDLMRGSVAEHLDDCIDRDMALMPNF